MVWRSVVVMGVVVMGVACGPSAARAQVASKEPNKAPEALKVADAHGLKAWAKVKRVDFTWAHRSGKKRSYTWLVPEQRVIVRGMSSGAPITIDLKSAHDKASPAWHAFINDSYWLLFELHLAWDSGVTITSLKGVKPPQGLAASPSLLRVQYGQVGPTPGDRYDLFIGPDQKSTGWAYHPAGAATPKLITTRERHVTQAGVTMPTLFKTPDGKMFIEITKLTVQ